MKVVHCECGTDVTAEDEDQLVEAVQAHVEAEHPEQIDKFDRATIRSLAHEH